MLHGWQLSPTAAVMQGTIEIDLASESLSSGSEIDSHDWSQADPAIRSVMILDEPANSHCR